LSATIKDAERNAPKAIIFSFLLAVLVTVIYQAVMYLALGNSLINLTNFTGVFPALWQQIFKNTEISNRIAMIFNIAVATSALGGSFGILLSNAWNLYTLAGNGHVFWPTTFTKLNNYNIPFACILVESLLCLAYFFASWGSQIVLQQISVLGCTIAYTFTILGLLRIHSRSLMAILALISCLILFGMCIWNFLIKDTWQLVYFAVLLAIGTGMFFWMKFPSKN
jgi:amino acid transporter